jgi:transcriptional regulator with XRE-family HTH domain
MWAAAFTGRVIVSRSSSAPPARAASAIADRLALTLGVAIREERISRQLSLRELARRAGISAAAVVNVEAGRRAGLQTYARVVHALGMDLEAGLVDPRRRQRSGAHEEDPVHAAMGELEAAHLRSLGCDVSIDEPYQHYQFAGRGDVVAWRVAPRALLHLENRTRFPNMGEAAGAYNAKRAYLAPVIAERLGLASGFRSVTHVMVGLWSAEVLHSLRIRPETFPLVVPRPVGCLRRLVDRGRAARGDSQHVRASGSVRERTSPSFRAARRGPGRPAASGPRLRGGIDPCARVPEQDTPRENSREVNTWTSSGAAAPKNLCRTGSRPRFASLA